ncbi:MAG: hypothetical protein II855_04620 [Candidatus Methanomethylophilaceae archaeon]|nr:hypothetical protein [Candidatus Methanomethylophilaceae archaeon]
MRPSVRPIAAVAAVLAMLALSFPIQMTDVSEASGLEHSDEYYYNQMGERDQALYRQIYAAAVNFESEFMSGYSDWNIGADGKEVKDPKRGINIVEAVRFDHPELFHLEAWMYHDSTGLVKLKFSMDKAEYDVKKAAIDDAVNGFDLSGLTRKAVIDSINREIATSTVYDKGGEHAHDISGVFVDKRAVCEGYGLAFKYLCNMKSIPCVCVEGDATSDGTEKVGHLWNYVMMGSKWYAMDVTWNDTDLSLPNPPYVTQFTLVGSETIHTYSGDINLKFNESHIPGEMHNYYVLPEIEETGYSGTIGTDTVFDFANPSTYYYDKLTANGKKAYTAIVKGLMEFNPHIETGVAGDANAIWDAVRAIRYDRQDLFQMPRGNIQYSPADGRLDLIYGITEDKYNEMRDAVLKALIPMDRALMGCGSVYERVLAIHDYIVSNTQYVKTDNAWDIYGTLVEGKCVCEGYARTFQYVCSLYGIEAICVSGDGYGSGDKPENHMWNLVRMNDGRWYGMDVTWDDPLVGGKDSGEVYYTYFLVGSDTKNDRGKAFSESHVAGMMPSDGKTHIFGSDDLLPEVYAKDYYIRPGQPLEIVIDGTVTVVDGNYVATVTLAELEEKHGYLQGKGTAVVMLGESGAKVGMTSDSLDALIRYMQGETLADISFTCRPYTGKIAIGPLEFENDAFAFGIVSESKPVKQSDIGGGFELKMYIPYSPSGFEFAEPLIRAWDVSTGKSVEGSTYENGFVCFTSDSMDSGFVAGSTPIKGLTVPMIVVVLIAVVLFILLLLRHHHRKKLRARNRH